MTRRRFIASVAAWSTVGASLRSHAAPAADSAALALLRTDDIGAWATLDAAAGEHRGRWIVDTGASRHVVDTRWADAAGLERRGSTRVTTVTGSRSVPLRALPALQAGALQWPASDALDVDLRGYAALTGVAVAGIVGIPLLAGRAVLLDVARGRLLASGDASAAAAALALQMPLALDDDLPVIDVALGARPPERFLLDTGNPGALVVFAHRAAELLRGVDLPRLRVTEPGGGIDVAYALLDGITVAGRRLPQIPVVLEAGAAARRGRHFDRLAGSVGLALFDALFVDAAAGLCRATPAPMPLPGGYGFTLRRGADAPVVHAVVDTGPAARAGVAPGDVLLAIDGAGVDGGRPGDVWTRLQPLAHAELRWRRDAAERVTPLARERFFPRLA